MLQVSTRPLISLPTVENRISAGAFGIVYKGKFNCKDVALKFLTYDKHNKKTIEREINALTTLQHPNICNMYGWFHQSSLICLVTEFLPGGELFHKVTNELMSEADIIFIFRDLFNAVSHMHHNNLIHCDIKLENIVLTENGIPKLIDFGMVNKHHAGTGFYLAPECFEKDFKLHKGIDVWALGICLYATVMQTFPFHQANYKDKRFELVCDEMTSLKTSFFNAILHAFNVNCNYSTIKCLLELMLCINIKKRCTISNLQQKLHVCRKRKIA